MKNLKKLAVVVAVVGVLGIGGAAFAATVQTPADIVSGLTGKSVEDLAQDRAAGKTYGTIAEDAGKLDEFKSQMLERRKALLDQRVLDGTLTQERADEMYKAMESNQVLCDSTGNAGLGMRSGAGQGAGSLGMGNGQRGAGRGMGGGVGGGMGAGRGLNK